MVWGAFGLSTDVPADKPEEASEKDADYPECDYDTNLTPLYEAIEERAWIAVNQFLHTGYWPESFFPDPMSPEDQARTWVTRYEQRPDGTKKVRWSQLPIHAAVIFGAPSVVIQQLVEAFPQSVRCTDDHRMLPLHLAFRHGSDDSVLALFLEEFPEAVNVRGYKGRLPVECAQKGPNPERGAIIQTILQKNQSAWERKKSANQLKELYCMKEALKIKGQKVSHLETAIREIKSREHKTRKELGITMTDLKAAKMKSKNAKSTASGAADSAERSAVKQLVEKLAALEMATKDLVQKEKETKAQLKQTKAELEAARRTRPTEDQAKQFAKLDKVASTEAKFVPEEPAPFVEEPKATASDVKGTPVKDNTQESAPKASAEVKLEETIQKSASKTSAKAAPKPVVDASMEKKGAQMPAESAVVIVASAAKSVEPAVSVASGKSNKTPVESSAASVASAAKSVEPAASVASGKSSKSKKSILSRLSLKSKATVKSFVSNKSKASTKSKELAPKPEAVPIASPTSEPEDSPASAPTDVTKAVAAPVAAPEPEAVSIAKPTPSTETGNEECNEEASVKEALVETIENLKNDVESLDEKTFKTQEELDAVSVPGKKPSKEMEALQAELAALKENSDRTKQDLALALQKLNEITVAQAKNMTAAEEEKVKEKLETEKARENAEKKVAVLETNLNDYNQKLSTAKTEMKKIETVVKNSGNVQLTPAQKKYFKTLGKAMTKLEVNAKMTQDDLDIARGELNTIKAKQDAEAKKEAEIANAAIAAANLADARATHAATTAATKVAEEALAQAAEGKKADEAKIKTVEQANKELEAKIAILEATMNQFEVKATETKNEMDQAMQDLMASDDSVASGAPLKMTKKQKKHMLAMEAAMKKLEERATNTKEQLDSAVAELMELKKNESSQAAQTIKEDNKALKELSKKIQVLQSAMVGFEVKETKTMQELERTMRELEEVSNKRFEVLSVAAEHSQGLAVDPGFSKEVQKLEKRADKEEKKMAELEAAVQDVLSKSSATKNELEETRKLLADIQAKNEQRGDPVTKEEKAEAKQDLKLSKELHKKVATLQSAIVGFEIKETRTMKELENTMKQLEELTSKRFEVLEKAAAVKEHETERLTAAGALAEEKVTALHAAMKELEKNSSLTHSELEQTKKELAFMKSATISGEGISKQVIATQEKQINELSEKITILQQAVTGFEVKETKTMQELEQTMRQLEELTAKRFEVLQKVAGREIEAVKTAEAKRYAEQAAKEQKKVAALESAMQNLESKASQTKLELEKAMKTIETLNQKQTSRSIEVSDVSKEETRVMRELVAKVADIQEAVMHYGDKELKTNEQLEATKLELEATKKEVETLRAQQVSAIAAREASAEIDEEASQAAESVNRVADETIASLETAIHQLVNKLKTEEVAPKDTSEGQSSGLRVVEERTEETASAVEEKPAEVECETVLSQETTAEPTEETALVAEEKLGETEAEAQEVVEPADAKGVVAEEKLEEMEAEAQEVVEPADAKSVAEESVKSKATSIASAPKSVKSTAKSVASAKSATTVKSVASVKSAKSAAKSAESVAKSTATKETEKPAQESVEVTAEPEAAVSTTTAATTDSSCVKPSFTPAIQPAVAVKPEKKHSSFFGKLKKSSKNSSETGTGEKKSLWNISFRKGKKNTDSTSAQNVASVVPAITTATAEQRKLVEASHGAEIAAVLTDAQILDIIRKMDSTAPARETVTGSNSVLSGLSKSEQGPESAAAMSPKIVAESVKSAVEEDAPPTSIDKLPSMNSASSKKNHRSTGSVVSAALSKKSAVTPVEIDESSATVKPTVSTADGAYDDGFEINF